MNRREFLQAIIATSIVWLRPNLSIGEPITTIVTAISLALKVASFFRNSEPHVDLADLLYRNTEILIEISNKLDEFSKLLIDIKTDLKKIEGILGKMPVADTITKINGQHKEFKRLMKGYNNCKKNDAFNCNYWIDKVNTRATELRSLVNIVSLFKEPSYIPAMGMAFDTEIKAIYFLSVPLSVPHDYIRETVTFYWEYFTEMSDICGKKCSEIKELLHSQWVEIENTPSAREICIQVQTSTIIISEYKSAYPIKNNEGLRNIEPYKELFDANLISEKDLPPSLKLIKEFVRSGIRQSQLKDVGADVRTLVGTNGDIWQALVNSHRICPSPERYVGDVEFTEEFSKAISKYEEEFEKLCYFVAMKSTAVEALKFIEKNWEI